jgi:hypothetical protein
MDVEMPFRFNLEVLDLDSQEGRMGRNDLYVARSQGSEEHPHGARILVAAHMHDDPVFLDEGAGPTDPLRDDLGIPLRHGGILPDLVSVLPKILHVESVDHLSRRIHDWVMSGDAYAGFVEA